jgi:hypothetical protein
MTPAEFIHSVYGDIHNDPAKRTPEELGKKAILTPLNDTVDDLNTVIVNMLPGEERLYQFFSGSMLTMTVLRSSTVSLRGVRMAFFPSSSGIRFAGSL